MDKDQVKKLFTAIALLYVMSFFIVNWNDVSWIFNYKEVSGIVADFFNPYPSINASAIDAYFYPNHSLPAGQAGQNSSVALATAVKNVSSTSTDKQNALEIPKISISVPIIFTASTNKVDLMKDLDLGVIYYPGSVYPGQLGQIVILGHSAPPGWPKIKHDWVFTDLDKLSPGDDIFLDISGRQYKYTVRQKTIIKKGADVSQDNLSASNNVLTLISCWPPGKDYQRIAVEAELVNN